MMSTAISVKDVREALTEDGFYCIQDPRVGLGISEMEQNGSQFSPSSEAGWEFCKRYVLKYANIRTTLESYKWCRLGYYRRIAEDQGHIFQLRKGGEKPDILLVHLWSKGSRAVYFPGSHLIPLKSVRAANRMWEVPEAALERAGIKGREIPFKNGGLAILDARLAFEMRHGSPVTGGLVVGDELTAVEDELKKWPKLVVPKLQDPDRMVDELESERINIHFAVPDKN
ncbi:hypothetical protein QBC46DRAFT_266087 [Diplogelasinospora grovesii]|uniref:Uncharacterized protein n=1 Tax=Diplogelasinospora grovesii TaxID=303347 RepID=A0AAN6N2Q5_9PEZI|nr:hypothetical protein QBC46DRAFT_266087 [Diplogelasinospora grovesii]